MPYVNAGVVRWHSNHIVALLSSAFSVCAGVPALPAICSCLFAINSCTCFHLLAPHLLSLFLPQQAPGAYCSVCLVYP